MFNSDAFLQARLAESEARLAQSEAHCHELATRLRESEARFCSVFEGMGEGLLMTDLDDVIEYANPRMEEMCGYSLAQMKGRPAYEVVLPRAEWPALQGRNERRAQGFSDCYEIELQHKSGARFWALVHATPLRDAEGQVVGTIGAQVDITQRRRAEDALRESEARFRALIEQAADAVMVHDAQGRMLAVNQRTCDSLGYTHQELLQMSVPQFEANFDSEKVAAGWAALQKGDTMVVQGVHRRKDGTTFPVEVHVGLVEWDGAQVILALARDVTERKRTQAEMEAALREKDVLLKEIHHRVKNNLQIISSLLTLQSDGVSDAGARAAFAESRNRVRSMSLIHEKLYQSHDLARIDFCDYLEALCASLLRTYAGTSGRVRLEVEADAAWLDIDRAVPCGLIVNELISNALKHAFPGARGGTIAVGMRAANGDFTLQVRDDGVGIAPDFDPETTESIGLQLVTGLTQQLGGECELSRESGTRWTIRFRG